MSITIRIIGIFAEIKSTVGAYSTSNYIDTKTAENMLYDLYSTSAKVTDLSYTDNIGNYIKHVIFTFY